MGKRSSRRKLEEQAQRRLASAQLQLHEAQQQRVQATTRGEEAIERARQRAAKWLKKATERVERRAAAVSKAEERVLAISARSPRQRPLDAVSQHSIPAASLTPDTAAELLEETSDASTQAESPLIVPQTVEVNRHPESGDSGDSANNSSTQS